MALLFERAVELIKEKENLNSVTTAKLADMVHSFMQTKASTLAPEDFLPYPELWKKDKKSSELLPKTKQILKALIATDSIGKKLTQLLAPYKL